MKRNARAFRRCRRANRVVDLDAPRERIAVFLDLENLLHRAREAGHAGAAVGELARLLNELAERGTIVNSIACCDCNLAPQLAFELASVGVRVFTHRGGPDAADHVLISRMREELPTTIDTVVIGSGDHLFSDVARELRSRGKRVELLATCGALSHLLYKAADSCTVLS